MQMGVCGCMCVHVCVLFTSIKTALAAGNCVFLRILRGKQVTSELKLVSQQAGSGNEPIY